MAARALRLNGVLVFAKKNSLINGEIALRRYVTLLLWLLLALWLLTLPCQVSHAGGDETANARVTCWRRTKLGWEDASQWMFNVEPQPLPAPSTAVHPLVIASLELLISVGALVLCTPSSRPPRQ